MIIDKEVIESLEYIKERAPNIFVRIKREKWKAVSISDMTALEFIDILILWINQERDIGIDIGYLKELADNLEPKTHCCECTPGDHYEKHLVHIQYPGCNCDPKKYVLKVNDL